MLNKFAAVAATRAPIRRGTVSKLVKSSASLYCKSKVTYRYRTISIKLLSNPFHSSSLSGVSTNLLENLRDVKVPKDIPSKCFTSAFTTPEDDSPKLATCTSQEKKIEDRIEFLQLSKKYGWSGSEKSCNREHHTDHVSNILDASKHSNAPEKSRAEALTRDTNNGFCPESLLRLPHQFCHDQNTFAIIQIILREFTSFIMEENTPRRPYEKHLRNACRLIDDEHCLQEILLEVLIRLPSQLIRLAGKKMDAKIHKRCYSISKEDMTCLMEECKSGAGVDPSSPGCVYVIAFCLPNIYQILDKTNGVEAFSKGSNRKNMLKLIEKNDNSSILYVGKTKNRAIERICGYTSNGFFPSHFESGVNSIILELLQQRKIEGEVIALPVVNFPQASTTMSDQTEIISLIFEAVLASVLSMDKALNIEEGNSTNIAPCGVIGFNKGTFDLRFTELIEHKEKHGHCAVPIDTTRYVFI